MMWQILISDNPLLVKHLRSRLRLQHLLPMLAVVVIISTLITWAAFPTEEHSVNHLLQARLGAFIGLLILQGVLLLLGGTASVAGSVALARESGMMDFHRISPQRPVALALGFFLGGPIREYLLFAATLPFMLILLLPGLPLSRPILDSRFADTWNFPNFSSHDPLHALGYLKVLLVLLVLGLLYHSFALLCGLVVPKTRGIAAAIVILIFGIQLVMMVPGLQNLTITPTLYSSMTLGDPPDSLTHFYFFGLHFPAFLLALLHAVPLLIFLFVAVVRKMRHERAYIFAKPYAVLFFTIVSMLIVGDALPGGDANRSDRNIMALVLFFMLLSGLWLSASVSPTAGDILKGIRHAGKLGLSRVSAWSDLSVNWAPMVAMSALLLLVGGMFLYLLVISIPNSGMSFGEADYLSASALPATLIAALTLLFFGLTKQYFDLRFKKNAMTYFALLLFIIWIVPLLLGWVSAIMTNGVSDITDLLLSFSPLGGIALLARDNTPDIFITLVIVAALTCAAVLLYIGAVRGAKRSVTTTPQNQLTAIQG